MKIDRKQVEHRGNSWPYFAAGDGLAAFLALAGSLGGSETLASYCSEMAPDRRIVVPAYAPVDTLEEAAGGVEAILRAERLKADTIYGGSFGGMIAQYWLRHHPDDVRRLILSGAGGPDPKRANKNRRWMRLLKFYPIGAMRFGMRFALKNMLSGARRDPDGWRKDYLDLIAGIQRRDLESRYRISIDFDENCRYTPDDLRSWPGKILILEGGADRIASAKIRESLRQLYPQATVHTIPNAGHSLMLSHPDEIIGAIRKFTQEP